MMFDFKDRTLVLTGAAGGIGQAIARLFHNAGARLVLADRDAEALERFARSLNSPEQVATICADAGSADDTAATLGLGPA